MARSSILGIDPTPEPAPGHDTAALGPGDSSDSGSDVAGLEGEDPTDPNLATDLAMRDDQPHPLQSGEALDADSDAAGTGERRSAGADSGLPDGSDIGVDRIFTPGAGSIDPSGSDDGTGGLDDTEDPDLAFVDLAEAGDPLDDEPEAAEEDEAELAAAADSDIPDASDSSDDGSPARDGAPGSMRQAKDRPTRR